MEQYSREGVEQYSREGVEILRSLALAVRSEQDFQQLPHVDTVVGLQQHGPIEPNATRGVKEAGGFQGLRSRNEYQNLNLRQSLNKIAHADPSRADFFVGPGNSRHDLILHGHLGKSEWLAIVSLVELISAVKSLPDHPI